MHDTVAMDEIVEQMRNLATLAASQWDRCQQAN